MIHIPGLDEDQLHSEFCDIKCFYDSLTMKNVKLSDQTEFYISSTRNDFYSSSINDEKMISLSNNHGEDLIRSDQLWAYLLNKNPNATPNLKKLICYMFSIPCTNSYVETMFSHMKYMWLDYRNRMDIELVNTELKIRMNCDYSCDRFHKYIFITNEFVETSS